jgi:PAS domain S-box-containing protein
MNFNKSLCRLAGSAPGDHQEKRPKNEETPFQKEDAGDVKDPRKVGSTQRESKSRYRVIVEAFDGLIYTCSPDYRVEFMNPRLIERTGYDGTGEYCYKVLHERNSICPWCVNDRVFQGETVRWEVQSPKDNRWYYEVSTPIYHSDGRVSKQAMIQDITGLKQTEEALRQANAELERRVEERTAHLKQANEKLLGEIEECRQIEDRLRESEARFLAFMQHLPGGAVIRDLQGRYLFANRAWEKTFGKKWQRKTLEEIWPVDKARHLRELDQQAVVTRQPGETLINLEQEDGIHTWLINRFPILGKDGPVMVGAVGLDVTRHRQAEAALAAEPQRLFAIFDELPVFVYLHGPDHIVRFANRVFRKHFGEPNGSPCYEILRGRSQPCEDCSTKRVLATQSPQESHWTSPSGRVYQTYGYPFVDADGSLLVLKVGIDITERRLAEEALYQEKERYRTLAEAAPSGISIIGKDGRYKYLNPKFEKMFGYTLDDIPTGREWFPKAFPDSSYREMVISDWKTEFKKPQVGEVRPRTFQVTCKDGTVKVIDFRSVALVTGDWLIFYEDISKRVQAEEALVKSEEQYRLLVNQIPAVVFKGYADGLVEFFDCKIESLTGYKKEDFDAGRLKWPDLVLKEDAPRFREAMLKALRGYRSYVREYRIRKQDGGILWIQGRGHIFCNASGQINHISGVLFDISERKRAEEALKDSEARYRLLAENVSDVIWTADMNLKLTYVSPSAEHLTGYGPKEVIQKGLEAILTPVSLEQARRVFAEEMLAEFQEPRDLSRSTIIELELIQKDGSVVWIEVQASFLRDEQERPIGILGVSRDINERKKVELALRRREAILEAVSFAAEKFLQSESWEQDIQNILGRLGQSADASRAYIFENHLNDAGDPVASQLYEWAAPRIEPQINNPKLQKFSWQEAGFGRWEEQLSQGQTIVGRIREFPLSEQKSLASQDIKSIVAVPIFLGQQWWGMIGFAECLNEREWPPVELEALKTAASTLGAAILRERAEQSLRKSEQKLRALAAQLLTAQENERKRLAAELHDELGHALLTLKLSIGSMKKQLTPEQISLTQEFKKMGRFIGDTIKEVRRLYHDLSPGDLEDLGLTEALRDMIEDVAALQKRIKWEIILDNLDGLFPLPVQTAIYRVVQEALTNIGKHARAKNVSIVAKRESQGISISIEDDGGGFESAKDLDTKRSLGLLTMEERVKILGGTFTLWSQKKRGTKISFTVPFPEGD